MDKNRFLGGKFDSGGDAGGGGEAIDVDAAVAGVHMSPGSGGGGEAIIGVHNDDQAGATFGNAGVGGLPAAAGMRRSPACAVDHSCGGEE